MHLAEADNVIRTHVVVPLNEYQRCALQLFILNAGWPAFVGSTLLKVLNKGDYSAVPAQLKRWVWYTDVKTGKKLVSDGLVNRRAAEVVVWLTPVEPTVAGLPGRTPVQGAPPMPTPPPQPMHVLQTSTGKATAAALVSGTTAAVTQASPLIDAIRGLGLNLSSVVTVVGVLGVLACVGFTAWTLWDRARKLRENGQ
jgi:hypothetical protein